MNCSTVLPRLLTITIACAGSCLAAAAEPPAYVIALHGGAGGWQSLTDESRGEVEATLRRALDTGRQVLAGGGASLDAVEATIRVMEDAPCFNSGKGAICNIDGEHWLDASIMDGRDRAAGGVTNITNVKNPISLARLVMEKSPHVLLGGRGAERFAKQMGVELVPQSYFHTPASDDDLAAWRKENPTPAPEASPQALVETVGCVALDRHGNLAAGTSTGGRTGKLQGRIGDSPIVGAGTYADNATCAVSGTGVGELYIRHAIAYDISARMAYKGDSMAHAMHINLFERLAEGTGGLIGIDHDGNAVLDFNTRAMPRGVADAGGRFEIKIER
ncbi:Isoaspartyl peptidase precursor [Posidoniimonas polymericola]|uniref:Isoaspartyl peptidase n=1 Tax=Posidoniimonas polymericola TaxID=2528002 RepID=A0A5C5YCM5_9BACT|nr:isoaspartyl peptidase/L-asparaginase [Posidoniimonas polymericola]TWT73467.1 Isoaspartyl peptidase precursor [Posidoniimonas polymericola]